MPPVGFLGFKILNLASGLCSYPTKDAYNTLPNTKLVLTVLAILTSQKTRRHSYTDIQCVSVITWHQHSRSGSWQISLLIMT